MANKGQRKKRSKWVPVLVAASLGLDLLLLGYMAYVLWSRMLEQATMAMASPTPTQAPIELWDAYEQARAAAQTQAKDAQLVSASTQWQAVSEQAMLDGASNWTFVFYSPTSNNSLDVTVNTGAAQVVNQTRVWGAPNPLTEGAWQAGFGLDYWFGPSVAVMGGYEINRESGVEIDNDRIIIHFAFGF